MKKNLFYSLMTLCAVLFASCGQEEIVSDNGNGVKAPVTISVQAPVNNPLSRAGVTVPDKPSAHLDTSVGQNLGVFGGIFQRVRIDDSGKAIYLRLFRRGGEMPMIRIFLEIAFIIGTQPVLCRIKETAGGIRLQCSA